MLKEITDKIVDILDADTQLADYSLFWGPPFTRDQPRFIYVKWIGGPIRPEDSRHDLWLHRWDIVLIVITEEDDVGEKEVQDKIERVRAVLMANPTLDGLVRDIHRMGSPMRMSGETVTVGLEWGKITKIISGARLQITYEMEETLG